MKKNNNKLLKKILKDKKLTNSEKINLILINDIMHHLSLLTDFISKGGNNGKI